MEKILLSLLLSFSFVAIAMLIEKYITEKPALLYLLEFVLGFVLMTILLN